MNIVKPVSIILLSATSLFAVTPDGILSAMDRNRDFSTVSYTGTMEIHVAERCGRRP